MKGEHSKWISGHQNRKHYVMDGTLTCRDCKEQKPVDDFHNHFLSPTGKAIYCKACHHMRSKWSHIGIKYGVTKEQYLDLLAKQGGGCAICGRTPDDSVQGFGVDHCHDSMRVRGLLCGNCNRGIGSFHHDPERLRRAAAYVEQ